MKKNVALHIILVFNILPVVSQNIDSISIKGKEPIQVRKTSTPMKIDGLADEASWQNADAYSFDFFYKVEKPTDKQATTLKMLWDEENLYLFYECKDQFITAREKERDKEPYFDDCAEIFLIPTPDKINMHFGFELNLYKASNDFIFINNIYKKENFVVRAYSPDFDVAVSVDGTLNDNSDIDQGWSIEMAIPQEAFHTDGPISPLTQGSKWAFMAVRQDRNDPEGNRRSTSTIFPLSPENPNVHYPKSFGIMKFIEE